MKKTFLVDFDGTITLEDSCQAMVEHFCRPGWDAINRQWEEGRLDTVQCARQTFALMETTLPDLEQMLGTIAVDPYFNRFLETALVQGHQVFVVSDGYDVNIRSILKACVLDRLTVFCNRLIYREGRFDLACPHFNEACGKCGTCKTTILKTLKHADTQIVYIGDGWSDHCPVHHADVVFAKDRLRQYCVQNGIPSQPYRSFQDVLDWLTPKD